VKLAILLLCLWAVPRSVFALGQQRYVESVVRPGSFPIAQGKTCAAIYVDSSDYPGVIRAAGDLRADIERVTGCTPVIAHDSAALPAHTIVVGSIGKSPLVTRLTDTAAIAGKWESFQTQLWANN